jgi:uncharacterized protein (DUF433 family)
VHDTSPITTEITRLITSGTTESELLAVVVRKFPDLTLVELSEALQVALDAAEKQAAARRH